MIRSLQSALLASSLGAAAPSPPGVPPEATAVRIETPPALDGKVIDDPAWAAATPVHEFWQTTPDENQPASERTEVRVLYTEDTIYFGVVCYDREPDRMVVSESRRDAPLADTDSFQIVLDTYRDGQNGFVFGTNPSALEHDGQVSREGEDGGGGFFQQSYNLNWDAAWEVRTLAGGFGWSAEFAIPFRTLRYAGGGTQVWGMNLQRNIRRRNETSFWTPLPRQFGLFKVSRAGTIRGLDLEPQRNLKLSPYLLGRSRRNYHEGGRRTEHGDVGADLKYSVTPSLTLDATVNTDFAQVEVDEEQVNLDRFTLFFPEKRPFFLENAGLFTAGTPAEVELFFSRRIGIGPAGEVVPILGGARLSGRLAGFNVGLLNMQTNALKGTIPANNFTLTRFGRELPNRSGVGALFIHRQATGSLAGPGDWNQTFAIDGRLGLGRYAQVAGWAAGTRTPGVRSGERAYHLGATYESPDWNLHAKVTQVDDAFNPEVGFLSRRGYRRPQFLIFRQLRLTNGRFGLHELRPHISYSGYFKPGGFHETGFLHVDNHFAWRSGREVHTGVNFTREGVISPFEIYPGVVVPPGTYDHKEFQLVLTSDEGKPVSFDGTVVFGGFFGGSRSSLRPTAKARAGENLNLDVGWTRNDVRLPAGRFVVNLIRTRLSYSFSPRLFVQALLQYNDHADRFSTNLRLGWLQTANTGLFIVYNETRDTFGSDSWPVQDRVLTVKFSRLFDLLN